MAVGSTRYVRFRRCRQESGFGSPGLARLVVAAAERTQLWLVTHSTRLAEAISAAGAGKMRVVTKRDGATQIDGLKAWGAFEEEGG